MKFITFNKLYNNIIMQYIQHENKLIYDLQNIEKNISKFQHENGKHSYV